MKRVFALLTALLILALPALAEPMSYFDYTDDILEDGSLIYYFPELSLQLPAEWRGKVMAVQQDNGTSFYQKASYEKYREEGVEGGGFLFMLGASVNGSFSQLPAFEYLGFSEESSLNYYLTLPTDYPAYMDDAIRAEYDAMSAQTDYVVEHARLYAEGADSADAGQGENQAADGVQGVTLEQARYHFEHSSMPRYFYEAPENMLKVLGESGVYRLWTALADENGVEYPYTAEDYAQNGYVTDDGTEILQIIMPKPEATSLCYRVYLVFDPGTGKAGYYTVEYDNLLGESAFLCGWTEAREHANYGGAAILDAESDDYETALMDEAAQIASLAGASTTFTIEKTGARGMSAFIPS